MKEYYLTCHNRKIGEFNNQTQNKTWQRNKHSRAASAIINSQAHSHYTVPQLTMRHLQGISASNSSGSDLSSPASSAFRRRGNHTPNLMRMMLMSAVLMSVAKTVGAESPINHSTANNNSSNTPDITTASVDTTKTSTTPPSTVRSTESSASQSSSFSNVIHTDSVAAVSRDLLHQQHNTTETQDSIEISMGFRDESCMNSVSELIFDKRASHSQSKNSGLIWTRADNSSAALIGNVNATGFATAVGEAAVNTNKCVTSLSAETINLPNILDGIQEAAVRRDLNKKLEPKSNKDVCLKSNEALAKTTDINANMASEIKTVECRPAYKVYNKPTETQVNNAFTHLAKELREVICVKKMAIISEGIDAQSDVVTQINQTLSFTGESKLLNGHFSQVESSNGSSPLNENTSSKTVERMTTAFVRSALRRCPDLQFTDVRATQEMPSTDNSTSSSTLLSNHRLIQALDAVLTQNGSLPESIVLLDIDEMADYHPDVSVVSAIVQSLRSKGVAVYAYVSSKGSWLSSIPGVMATPLVTETVIRRERASADEMDGWFSFPDEQERTSYSSRVPLLASLGFATVIGFLGLCVFCKLKNRMVASVHGKDDVRLEEIIIQDPVVNKEQEIVRSNPEGFDIDDEQAKQEEQASPRESASLLLEAQVLGEEEDKAPTVDVTNELKGYQPFLHSSQRYTYLRDPELREFKPKTKRYPGESSQQKAGTPLPESVPLVYRKIVLLDTSSME